MIQQINPPIEVIYTNQKKHILFIGEVSRANSINYHQIMIIVSIRIKVLLGSPDKLKCYLMGWEGVELPFWNPLNKQNVFVSLKSDSGTEIYRLREKHTIIMDILSIIELLWWKTGYRCAERDSVKMLPELFFRWNLSAENRKFY